MSCRIFSSGLLLAVVLLLSGSGTVTAADLQAASADFNHDGQIDYAVLHSAAQAGAQTRYRLEVFSGGAHRPVVLDDFEASWHSHIVARDLDGDNDADLILFSAAGTPARVWINDGSGHLSQQLPSSDIRPESPAALLSCVPELPVIHCALTQSPSVLPRPAPVSERVGTKTDPAAPAVVGRRLFPITAPLFKRPPPALHS